MRGTSTFGLPQRITQRATGGGHDGIDRDHPTLAHAGGGDGPAAGGGHAVAGKGKRPRSSGPPFWSS